MLGMIVVIVINLIVASTCNMRAKERTQKRLLWCLLSKHRAPVPPSREVVADVLVRQPLEIVLIVCPCCKCDHDRVYFLSITNRCLICPIVMKIGDNPDQSGPERRFCADLRILDISPPSMGIWPACPISHSWRSAVLVPKFHGFWNILKTFVFRCKKQRNEQKEQFQAVILVPITGSNFQ